mgnify:FL=1
MSIAFVTCTKLPAGSPDDHEAAALLGAEFVIWDDPTVDWNKFDKVIVRSVWDYTLDRDGFVAWARAGR